MRAHVRWRTLRHYDDPVGWVRRVAINLLHDDHRRATRKRRAIARAGRRARPGRSTRRSRTGWPTCSPTLPRQQRIAVALYYVDGLSVAEVADGDGTGRGLREVAPARRPPAPAGRARSGGTLMDEYDGLDDDELAAALRDRADALTADVVDTDAAFEVVRQRARAGAAPAQGGRRRARRRGGGRRRARRGERRRRRRRWCAPRPRRRPSRRRSTTAPPHRRRPRVDDDDPATTGPAPVDRATIVAPNRDRCATHRRPRRAQPPTAAGDDAGRHRPHRRRPRLGRPRRTYDSTGGSITVRLAGGAIALVGDPVAEQPASACASTTTGPIASASASSSATGARRSASTCEDGQPRPRDHRELNRTDPTATASGGRVTTDRDTNPRRSSRAPDPQPFRRHRRRRRRRRPRRRSASPSPAPSTAPSPILSQRRATTAARRVGPRRAGDHITVAADRRHVVADHVADDRPSRRSPRRPSPRRRSPSRPSPSRPSTGPPDVTVPDVSTPTTIDDDDDVDEDNSGPGHADDRGEDHSGPGNADDDDDGDDHSGPGNGDDDDGDDNSGHGRATTTDRRRSATRAALFARGCPRPASDVEEAGGGDAGADGPGDHADAEDDQHHREQEAVGHDERGEPAVRAGSP